MLCLAHASCRVGKYFDALGVAASCSLCLTKQIREEYLLRHPKIASEASQTSLPTDTDSARGGQVLDNTGKFRLISGVGWIWRPGEITADDRCGGVVQPGISAYLQVIWCNSADK